MSALRLIQILPLVLLLHCPSATARQARLPAMHASQVSVSGLSAGGYMAVQFEVAFSASVMGAGIIAGGPYYCAQGNVYTATTACSCTNTLYACRVRPGGSHVPQLIAVTDLLAIDGAIDPPAGLLHHKIWMLSGSADTLVPRAVMDDLKTYYRHYVDASQISYRRDLPAQHAMPTDSYGKRCDQLGSPYINNCGYDAAGALLQWIYGPLLARNSGPRAGRLLRFNQGEFLPNPTWHGMADSGYLYLPPGCDDGSGCKLHVVFHGCLQDPTNIGLTFVEHAGYNSWADSNRIMLLYPQAAPLYPVANPQACWDWFSYDDPRYAQQAGHQMAAVKRMVDRLTGNALP
ncbi:MAG: hypothetical protein ACEQSK_01990 [Sphingomonadaceae bacterium]